MKVFIINSVCGTGSTGGMIADMVRRLRQNGHQGLVGFGIGEGENVLAGEAFRFNNRLGYYCHNLLARLTDHTGLYSGLQTRKLIREMKKFDPDVVHIHNLHGYYVNYEILFRYLSRSGKKIVWTLHDCWAFTGHCTHYTQAGCRQWETGCRQCSQLREYPVCYTRGDTAGNYRRKKAAFTGLKDLTIVAPSQWLADQVKRSFLGQYPIQVIHNGIDTDIFAPQPGDFAREYGLQGKKNVLGVANVWNRKKGLQDACRLADLLPEEYQVVLLGLTGEQLRQLPKNVVGVERTGDRNKLAQIYAAADVFVNPTYEDTYNLTSLEAQACGTPVVAYHVGGCPETVQPGCGQTVACGDVAALADAVMDWCRREAPLPVDRDSLSADRCCAQYYDLYCRLTQET